MAGWGKFAGRTDLIGEILESSNVSRGRPCPRDARKTLTELCRLDYGKALRGHFSPAQLRGLVKELRSFLPELNRQVFSETDLRRLAVKASTFGVELRPRAFDGEEGRTLRGFYVHDRTILKRPLIVVNTTHHVVSVAAAFWHEMGHHLTHVIFAHQADQFTAPLSTTYREHLAHPEEIAADIVTVLAGYPKSTAQRLFRRPANGEGIEDTELLVSRVRPYVKSVTGFEFDRRFSRVEALHYLAGMIHVTKLRAALLREFEI
jgi:hypothetical protein